MINIISILPDFMAIYGENSYISPEINYRFIEEFNMTFYWITNFASKIAIEKHITTILILSIYFLSLILIFLEIQKMLFSIISLFIHVMLVNTSYLFSYGADYFITFSLFICILMSNSDKCIQSFSIRFLQIQLCIVYFFAGFGKALGTDWIDGNAMWYVFNIFIMKKPTHLSPIFKYLFTFISLFTIFIEIFYPLLVSIKKTRKIIIISILFLHLGIALFMGLYTFGFVMIILNIIAWEGYFDTEITKLKKYATNIRFTQHQL
ncbi:MAG: hypothetical protein Q4G16_04630 [Cruoricaptor ignavus]|nr:hypothetical protein [Cruoricaptor ignavus]